MSAPNWMDQAKRLLLLLGRLVALVAQVLTLYDRFFK